MIDRCANPSCDRTFGHPIGGTLFLFGSTAFGPTHAVYHESLGEDDTGIECFWLCPECVLIMTILSSTGGNPVIIPVLEGDRRPGWSRLESALRCDLPASQC
jgi:hypothetical protein